MDASELERIVRRVVREEFTAHGMTPLAPRPERRTNTGHESDENTHDALAYLQRIDPDGRMTKQEAADSLRARFPYFFA